MPGRVPFAMYPGKNFFRTLSRVEKTKSSETSCRKTCNDEYEEDSWKYYQIGVRDREQIALTKKVEINVITEKERPAGGGREKTRAR